jgi:hypothetical protein
MTTSKKPLEDLEVISDIFSEGKVSEIIRNIDNHDVGTLSYREAFLQEVKSYESQNCIEYAEAFQILSILVSFHFNPSDKNQPFQPLMTKGSLRSPIPEDLTNEQIDKLKKCLADITDAKLLARFTDIIWLKCKLVEYAHKAIDNYLLSAKDERVAERPRFEFLERAFRISKQINSKEKWDSCIIVFNLFKNDSKLYKRLNYNLIILAQELKIFTGDELIQETKRLSKLSSTNCYEVKNLLSIAATELLKLNRKEEAKDCHRLIALNFIQEAKNKNNFAHSHYIEDAIRAMRTSGAPKDEINKLNEQLKLLNLNSLSSMKEISSPAFDCSHIIKSAKEHVKDLSPFEVLRQVAMQFPIRSLEKQKKEIQDSFAKHPLMYLIQHRTISENGRQYAIRPSFMTDDEKELKIAYNVEIARLNATNYQMMIELFLNPALENVHWSYNDYGLLYNFIHNSPFVPIGRGDIFFEGVKSGIERNFLHSAHILIPQIENSIRFLLESNGVNVISINHDNTQKEKNLNDFFANNRTEIKNIFKSDDFIHALESFLCLKEGQNFRNELAHGLINHAYDYRMVVTWWLVLHLIFTLKHSD